MMGKYAQGTTVATGRSVDEIKRTIKKYGGEDIRFGEDYRRCIIGFRLANVPIMIEQLFPDRQEYKTSIQFEAEIRRLYRVLLLRIKARLEMIEAGEPVTQAFLPYIVGGHGQTVQQILDQTLKSFVDSGQLPPLLLPGPIP